MKKTILCLLLALGLLLMGAAAMAASDPDNYFFDLNEGNITIEDADTSEMVKVTYGNPQTTTAEFDPQEHGITVGGGRSSNSLQLSINTTVPVTIRYLVYIGAYSYPNTISIADNADVTLSLTGSTNDVNGTTTQPGIELGSGSKLTIQATADNNILRVYGSSNAILGPDDDEPPATVILNSGTVTIIPVSGYGISGNVNLVINGGQFVTNGKDIDVNSLIITGGELLAGSDSGTKVTYDGLQNNPDSYSNIHYAASILPHSVDNYGELIVFDELTLPVDLTIPAEKKLLLASYHNSSLTIPDDRSLTCNGRIHIYTDSTLTNNGTLTIKNYSLLTGKMTNTGTLIINDIALTMCQGPDFGTLNNTGTISGTGRIDPQLSQNQPKFLTIESIENGTITLSVPVNANATAEYSRDGTSWQDSPVFTGGIPTEGCTFYARYKANNFFNASGEASITVYPVKLNANGGTIASGKDVGYYIAGQGVTLPTNVTRAGYTFAGWYANKDLTGSPVTQIGATETGAKEYWARWLIVNTDPDGAVVSGDAAFDKLPPVRVPTLVLPEGTTLGGSVMLKYVKIATTQENTAIYDVYLTDQDGNRVRLPAACTLCLPYPEGMDQSSASAYRIHILHEMDGGGSKDFDSESGGLELTAQGLCVRASSLGRFTITWERLPEIDPPPTGDSSHPGLWLALGLISLAALAMLALHGRKSRAS